MKKMITILFIAVITAVNMNAQEQPRPAKKTPQERAENMSKRMAKELLLSPEQETKVKEAILKRELKREEKMEQMKTEMEKIDAEFKTILTSEQFAKFKTKQEEMKKKRMNVREKHPANRMPPPAGEEMPLPPAPEPK